MSVCTESSSGTRCQMSAVAAAAMATAAARQPELRPDPWRRLHAEPCGTRASTIVCQPQGDALRLSRKSRPKARIASRAAGRAGTAGDVVDQPFAAGDDQEPVEVEERESPRRSHARSRSPRARAPLRAPVACSARGGRCGGRMPTSALPARSRRAGSRARGTAAIPSSSASGRSMCSSTSEQTACVAQSRRRGGGSPGSSRSRCRNSAPGTRRRARSIPVALSSTPTISESGKRGADLRRELAGTRADVQQALRRADGPEQPQHQSPAVLLRRIARRRVGVLGPVTVPVVSADARVRRGSPRHAVSITRGSVVVERPAVRVRAGRE